MRLDVRPALAPPHPLSWLADRPYPCGYVGRRRLDPRVTWLQLIETSDEPDIGAAAWIFVQIKRFEPVNLEAPPGGCLRGMALYSPTVVEDAVNCALESGFDLLMLCGNGNPCGSWPELSGPPDLTLVRDTIATLRALNKEEAIDLIWYGGARSGTDAAKLIAMGCKAVVYGLPVALAVGGSMSAV